MRTNRDTPIERIFRKVMGREMPPPIKKILLPDAHPNLLDYPGAMSQWEKESLIAESRLASARRKVKRQKPAKNRKP